MNKFVKFLVWTIVIVLFGAFVIIGYAVYKKRQAERGEK